MREKILIVEDNPQNMRLMEMILRGSYTILKATDGQAALDIAIREHPDLIIMDIQLPKLSGIEVTGRLRKIPEFRDVLIIAITAYAMKGDGDRFIAAGCNAYLAKPISTRELPGMVARMLSGRKQAST